MKMYTAQEMRVRADYLEGALADAKTAAMLRQAADMMEREKDEALHSTALRTHETNFDRFVFPPEMDHGAQVSTAFSSYLKEQYSPKLRVGEGMDRSYYYDFLLWLFSAPGGEGSDEMSKGAVNFSETAIEYYTPKSLVDMFGRFDYDPATTDEQAKRLGIPNYDTIDTDGLKADWTQYRRIWINPPFNIKHLFWDKACETYDKCRNEIYFLCPIEFLTTSRFHDSLDKRKLNVNVALPNGRIKFISGYGMDKKSPAFGSVVVTPTWYMECRMSRIEIEN